MHGKKKRIPLPVEIWKPGAVEQWLEEMAAEGWMLEECGGHLMTFAAQEPKHCRFRLQPEQREGWSRREERLALYEVLGWEYVDELRGFELYYCQDPTKPELETDAMAQRWAWERSLKKEMGSRWMQILVLTVLTLWAGSISLQTVDTFVQTGSLNLFMLVAVPWSLVNEFCDLRSIRNIRRQLAAGVALAHSGNSAKVRRRANREFAVFVMICAANIAVNPLLMLFTDTSGDLEEWSRPVPYIAAEQLDPSMAAELRDHGWVEWDWMLLAPNRYRISEFYPQQRMAQNTYDRLRFDWLAELLYEEKLADLKEQYQGCEILPVQDARFDRAIIMKWGGVREFLALRETTVYSLWVNFPAELQAHTDAAAEVMSKDW